MKLKRYYLKAKQIDFLKNHITNETILKKLDPYTNLTDSSIDLSEEDIAVILDELTFLFTSDGLKETSEPNDLGFTIEELIDALS